MALLQLAGVLALLIGPGLIAVFIGRELRPTSDVEPSADSTVLEAFAYSVLAGVGAIVVAALVSWWNDEVRVWAGLQLTELVSNDPWSVVQQRPAQVVVIASAQYLGYLLLLCWLGWRGFFVMVTHRAALAGQLTRDDPYVTAVSETIKALKAKQAQVKIRLDNGDEYVGIMQSASARPNTDGQRDIFIGSAARIVDGKLVPLASSPGPYGVVINTRRVIAVELGYE